MWVERAPPILLKKILGQETARWENIIRWVLNMNKILRLTKKYLENLEGAVFILYANIQ